MLNLDFENVEASISVLPEKTVTLKPTFNNMPSGLNITQDMISVDPPSILLAGTQEVLNRTDSITLEAIDFANLKNETYTFELAIDIPSDCKNISNASTAKVTLDLSPLSSKTITVEHFTVNGLTSDYTSEITQKNIDIAVYGPKNQIDKLTGSNITAVIDTSSSSGTIGSVSMPVSFTLPESAAGCWVSGSYKANLTISEK